MLDFIAQARRLLELQIAGMALHGLFQLPDFLRQRCRCFASIGNGFLSDLGILRRRQGHARIGAFENIGHCLVNAARGDAVGEVMPVLLIAATRGFVQRPAH